MNTDVNTLQLEIFKNIRLCNEQFDKIGIKLDLESKNPKLSSLKRKIIKEDLQRLRAIKKQLRDLEIMDSFYNTKEPLKFTEI